jgi:hypothetical protein
MLVDDDVAIAHAPVVVFAKDRVAPIAQAEGRASGGLGDLQDGKAQVEEEGGS